MSRVTNLNRYPKQYLEIADTIEGGKAIIELGPFKSRAEASNKRLDLYAFRASLEGAGFGDDYPRFAATRMYISKKAPWVLQLIHADAGTIKVKKSR